jgi:hypothetical protein
MRARYTDSSNPINKKLTFLAIQATEIEGSKVEYRSENMAMAGLKYI